MVRVSTHTARGCAAARGGDPIAAALDRLRGARDEIVQAVYAHLQEAVPDAPGVQDAVYQAGLMAAVAAVFDYLLQAVEHGPEWSAPVPSEAAAQARRAARAGVSAGTVLRRYVAGHRRLGELIAQELGGAGAPEHQPVLLYVRQTQERLLERLAALIEHEYEQERRRIERSPGQRRLELVRGLLAGQAPPRGALAQLGYELEGWHLGAIALGPAASDTLERLRPLGRLLVVSESEETAWGWIGSARKLVPADLVRLHGESAAASLAVGEPASGIDGWRRTHRQAQDALQVLLRKPQPCVRYADVALLAPWLAQPDRARGLVELYLSPLDVQRDKGVLLRLTLRVYLDSGRNASAAARTLGIDRRTLAHRLEKIECCLGHTLSVRLPELEVALRLHELLHGPDSPDDDPDDRPECTKGAQFAPRIGTLA